MCTGAVKGSCDLHSPNYSLLNVSNKARPCNQSEKANWFRCIGYMESSRVDRVQLIFESNFTSSLIPKSSILQFLIESWS